MSASCINLRERFGRRYKVTYEPSYFAEHGAGARVAQLALLHHDVVRIIPIPNFEPLPGDPSVNAADSS